MVGGRATGREAYMTRRASTLAATQIRMFDSSCGTIQKPEWDDRVVCGAGDCAIARLLLFYPGAACRGATATTLKCARCDDTGFVCASRNSAMR